MPHPSDGHAGHDPLLVAAYAAGDAAGSELDDALALVAACPDCATLHHDLRAIATATAALPPPVRTSDFRLTPEQAATLRPAGWRRWLAPFAGPRFAFAGPLGGGLAALGVAGILLAGGVGLPMGGASSALSTVGAAVEQSEAAGMASAAPAELPAAQPAPSAGVDDELRLQAAPASPQDGIEAAPDGQPGAPAVPADKSSAAGEVPTTSDRSMATTPASDAATLPLLPLVSGVALLVGVALVLLRLVGRRLAASG